MTCTLSSITSSRTSSLGASLLIRECGAARRGLFLQRRTGLVVSKTQNSRSGRSRARETRYRPRAGRRRVPSSSVPCRVGVLHVAIRSRRRALRRRRRRMAHDDDLAGARRRSGVDQLDFLPSFARPVVFGVYLLLGFKVDFGEYKLMGSRLMAGRCTRTSSAES